MQAYFKVVEGQVPSPEWVSRLNSVAAPFRKLRREGCCLCAMCGQLIYLGDEGQISSNYA
jgi:hypothetical protein